MSGYRSRADQEQPLGGLSVRRPRGRTDSGNQDGTPREEGAETPCTPYSSVAIEIHQSDRNEALNLGKPPKSESIGGVDS